jgi:hypothetical protein
MRRRGALLLEVVVALAIMTAALGLLGAQLVSGLKVTQYAERQTRVSELADGILALLELDQQLQERVFNDRQTDGDFGDSYPGYFWRIEVLPTDVDGLGQVRLEILYQNDESKRDQIDAAEVVRTLGLLKANPGRIDLAADFGASEEQLAQLTDVVPIPGFDPTALDPQQLVSLDPQTLLALLPQIMELLQTMGIQTPPGGEIPTDPEGLREYIEGQLGAAGGRIPGGDGGDTGGPALGGLSPGGAGRGGRGSGGRAGGLSAEQLEQMIRDRAAAGGAGGGGSGNRGGGNRGGNQGGGNAGGQSGGTRDGSGNAGGNRGGGNRGGSGNQGGSGGRGGNTRGGSGPGGHYTIEDLMRMRDEHNRRTGGGG